MTIGLSEQFLVLGDPDIDPNFEGWIFDGWEWALALELARENGWQYAGESALLNYSLVPGIFDKGALCPCCGAKGTVSDLDAEQLGTAIEYALTAPDFESRAATALQRLIANAKAVMPDAEVMTIANDDIEWFHDALRDLHSCCCRGAFSVA